MTNGTDIFSIWENLKAEKKLAQEQGLSGALKKRVLIVDGYNTFIRCFAAIPTLNEDGQHTGGVSGFLKSVGHALKLYQPDRCVVVFDGPGGSMKRRKLFPDYKQHKHVKVRLNRIYEENTSLGEEEVSLKKQLLRLVVYIQYLPMWQVSLDHVEADDTIAYMAVEHFKNWEVIIMSSDKDFLQLVNDHVQVWSPTKKKLYGPHDVLNEYGVSSENYVFYRALTGDDSDNVPGVRGFGLKTVLKAFPMMSGVRVTLDAIRSQAEANRGKLKVYDTLLENWSDFERNYALMQLSETALTTVAQLHVNDVLNQSLPKYSKYNVGKLIIEDKLWNDIPNYVTWTDEAFGKLSRYVNNPPKQTTYETQERKEGSSENRTQDEPPQDTGVSTAGPPGVA